MLRTIFVAILSLIGVKYALQSTFGALMFYLWLAYFRPETWMWNPSFVLALNLSFFVGVFLLVRGLPALPSRPMELRSFLLLAFLVLTGISSWVSGVEQSWDRWIEFAKSTLVSYLLFVLSSKDLKSFRITLLVIAFSLGLEAAKQGYAGLVLRPGGRNDNALPHLGDNNGVAVGMLMLAALFPALANTATSKTERWIHRLFTFGVAYRAITSYSRGAFLAAGAMTIVYVLRSNHKFKAAIGAVVIAGTLASFLPQEFWDRMNTINTSPEEEREASSASRLHFWAVAMDMARDNPILGIGYNAYNYRFNDYDFLDGYYGRGRSVHSMWFGIIAELGYTGIVLFTSILALAFTGMWSVARRARKGLIPMDFYHYAVAIQAAFTALFVGGSFVPWQYTEMLWHFVALSMALRAMALEWKQEGAVDPVTASQAHRVAPLRPAAAMRREHAAV